MYLFFSDMDGTLLDDKKQVSDYSRKTIERFRAAGHKFIVATGRSLDSLQATARKNGFEWVIEGTVICHNGSIIYDLDSGEILAEYRIPKADALELVRMAEALGIYAQTYNSRGVVAKSPTAEAKFYVERTVMNIEYADDISTIMDEDPCKAVAITLGATDMVERYRQQVAEVYGGKYTTFFSSPQLLEVIDARSGKGQAVRFVADRYKVDIADVYAVGDEENDHTMIQTAGRSVAMLNANPKIKAIASTITEYDNNHDGVARMIEKLMGETI